MSSVSAATVGEESERRESGVIAGVPYSVAVAALLAIVALALAIAAVAMYLRDRPPGNSSAEAGFARDMETHHAQAVLMALKIRDRTEDPALRSLATDIILTQQAQIGQLNGWLEAWGASLAGDDEPMAWMGHDGPMPGMASQEALNQLDSLPTPEAEILFLQLMIRHHEGALPMAEAILERSDRKEVRLFAEGVIRTQSLEIERMREMLAERGVTYDGSTEQQPHH